MIKASVRIDRNESFVAVLQEEKCRAETLKYRGKSKRYMPFYGYREVTHELRRQEFNELCIKI